jgi:putative restriction endonuclease
VSLTLTVAADEQKLALTAPSMADTPEADIRRRYVTRLVRQRLHQRAFRERVLEACREHCSVCRLRHDELLEAAHIVADSDLEGEPVVSHGLALCKLHHAAFDAHILGVHPDYRVEIRLDVLEELDGPMLKHGLQGFMGRNWWCPVGLPTN